MISGCLNRAGGIACLVFCAACAQVALMSVTPVIAALASHLDQGSAREIVELEKKRDWPGMLSLGRALLQREPGRADWWFLQGYALARQGQHAAAIESYQHAVRISPEDEGSWLSLGQSQSALGQMERAIQTYRQALRYRPESAQAYLALADLYIRQGRPDLAIPNYRESVRYGPDSAQSWYGLAAAYQSTGQRERRDEALQGLRKLDPAAADQFEKQYRSN
ncbi:MAG: tetratricopeptide repeat protein [Betaproteobacteria bacterium]|nr:tetratricopeptide repeat protein [Betaproteobacteria bacterium]